MRGTVRFVVAALGGCLLLGCSALLDVHGAGVGGTDVARDSTFSIDDALAPPAGYVKGDRSEEVVQRASGIASRVLVAKGYVARSGAPGDFRLRIGAGRRDATFVPPIIPLPLPSGQQAGRVEASEREDIAEGALVVDAFDTATGEMVWHGAARVVIDPTAIDDKLLERAVVAILATFPGHATPR